MSRVRVLHAITMLELGGAQRNTLDTVASLDRNRFEPALACADTGELLPEARRLVDVPVIELAHLRREVRPVADLRALAELRRAIRAFAPTIVHTHSSKAGVLGRLAAHLERVPVVVHSIHGFGFGRHQGAPTRAAFLAAERLAARWTDAFVAVSRANLEAGVGLGLFRRDQARVIRSGIDLAAFRAHTGGEAVRAELGIPPAVPLVVQVSCLKPQKAPERFVTLAAALAARLPSARFLLVGDGAMRPTLERARARAGLETRLHFAGWRSDLPAIYDGATVVTLTSRFEGLPRVLVESLACGVPVVAMAVDGVGEVVREGINGFLVEEGDVTAMAERVARVLERPELRGRLSAQTGVGLEAFDREVMVREQEALYGELITARQSWGSGSPSAAVEPALTDAAARGSAGG
jgi:glycosyltransferase involved in cell wall biosynthesis